MVPSPDDAFLDEVLDLFVQEAREWLDQLQGALRHLEVFAEGRQRTEAFATIQRALTNLGGSAATVEQPAIEQAAFAVLPLAQALQAEGDRASPVRVAALKDALDAVGRAITGLAERRAAPEAELEPVLQRIAAAIGQSEPLAEPLAGGPPESAMRQAERGAAPSCEPKPVSEPVGTVEPAEPVSFRRLEEWGARHQQLVAELRAGLPAVERLLAGLKADGAEGAEARDHAGAVIEAVARLETAAGGAGASAIQTLLHGLRLFIRVAAAGKIPILPGRFKAVEARVGALLPMAEAWGRAARSTPE